MTEQTVRLCDDDRALLRGLLCHLGMIGRALERIENPLIHIEAPADTINHAAIKSAVDEYHAICADTTDPPDDVA